MCRSPIALTNASDAFGERSPALREALKPMYVRCSSYKLLLVSV